MRRLMILRHSKAERPEPGGGDQERTLNQRGRGDAGTIGAYMVRHGLIPDRVVVSTAVRTRETWQHAAGAFPADLAVVFEQRLYDAVPQTILDVIKRTPDEVHSLLVIAHNPGLHRTALMLIGAGDVDARQRLSEKLPTSGLVVIDFAVDDWGKLHRAGGRLDRFVTPRSVAEATD
jgi:phosphohistidine phosphatase